MTKIKIDSGIITTITPLGQGIPLTCPICDATTYTPDDDVVNGELFECDECGTELEVIEEGGEFFAIEAPEECEDWGE